MRWQEACAVVQLVCPLPVRAAALVWRAGRLIPILRDALREGLLRQLRAATFPGLAACHRLAAQHRLVAGVIRRGDVQCPMDGGCWYLRLPPAPWLATRPPRQADATGLLRELQRAGKPRAVDVRRSAEAGCRDLRTPRCRESADARRLVDQLAAFVVRLLCCAHAGAAQLACVEYNAVYSLLDWNNRRHADPRRSPACDALLRFVPEMFAAIGAAPPPPAAHAACLRALSGTFRYYDRYFARKHFPERGTMAEEWGQAMGGA